MKWTGLPAYKGTIPYRRDMHRAIEKKDPPRREAAGPRVLQAVKEVRLFLGDGQWKPREEVANIISQYTKSYQTVYDLAGVALSEDTQKYMCIPNDLTPLKEPK